MREADLVIVLSSDVSQVSDLRIDPSVRTLNVLTKSDRLVTLPNDSLAVSALTGSGMATLVAVLEGIARDLAGPGGTPALSRARHRMAIEEAVSCLELAGTSDLPELVGEELRLSVLALGRITGRVGVEDVLDSVFSQFCIGK